LASLQWTADSRALLIQQLNRLQNTNDLLVADARSGDVRRAYRDTNAAWVDTSDDLTEIDGGRAVTWTSEKDGWRHLTRGARRVGRTLTVWFGDQSREYVCEETGDEVVLMKDEKGNVIGFEKLNFSVPNPTRFHVEYE